MKGIIEYRYNSTPSRKERYYTCHFKSLVGMLWVLIKISRKKCDKIYIHFDHDQEFGFTWKELMVELGYEKPEVKKLKKKASA